MDQIQFLHFRFERYGKGDSPDDNLVYHPEPFQRFGKKINLLYPDDVV